MSPRVGQNLAHQIVDSGDFMQFAELDCDVYDFTFRQFLEKLISNDLENKQNILIFNWQWNQYWRTYQ